jgi:gliding motility-associated-like protein
MSKKYLLLIFIIILNEKFCFAQESIEVVLGDEERTKIGNNLFSVRLKSGYQIQKNNKKILDKQFYEMIAPFSENRAAIIKDKKWGFINENGFAVIPPMYKIAYPFKKGISHVFSESKGWLLINSQGLVVKNLNNYNYDSVLIKISEEQSGIKYEQKKTKSESINVNNSIDGIFKQTANNASSVPQSCPINIDFENGDFTNWVTLTGNTKCTSNKNLTTLSVSQPSKTRHLIYSKSSLGVDPYGGFPTTPPDGSNYAVKLGNTMIGAEAEGMRYSIKVPSGVTNYSISYQYAVVFEDPNHLSCEQPRFGARIFDPSTNSYIPCSVVEYISSGNIPGFFNSPINSTVKYRPWSKAFINLAPFAGKTVNIEFYTIDCTKSGHWGYAYFDIDSDCSNSATFDIDCFAPYKTTLIAPPGFQSYRWLDASNNLIGSTEKVILNPGPPDGSSFKVELIPYNGPACKDEIPVVLNRTELTAFFNDPGAQCLTGNLVSFINSSTINNGTIISTTWDFGDGKTGIGNNVTHKYSSSGTYTVTMTTQANGQCTSTFKRQVVIFSDPQVKITTSDPLSFCDGGTAKLTADVQAGSGTISNYLWTRNGILISGQNTSTISATLAGDYKVEVINSNGCRQISLPITITVNSIPVGYLSVEGNDQQCFSGNSFSFSSNSIFQAGITISNIWDFGDGKTESGNNVTHKYSTSGTYNVTLTTQANGQCPIIFKKQIIVFSDPTVKITASDSLTFCDGGSAKLTAEAQAGSGTISNYLWTRNNLLINGQNSPTITAALTGDYKVDVINSNGCRQTSAPIAITVFPLPIGNISLQGTDTICEGSSKTLTATGGNNYNWFLNGVPIAGVNGASFTANQPGDYTVESISREGCKKKLAEVINLKLVKKPTAVFSAPDKCVGLNVPFFNTSIYAGSQPVIWNWDFGDNDKSELFSPGHTYKKGGDYTTTLKVTPVSCPQLVSSTSAIIKIDEPRPNIRYNTINAIMNNNTALQARTFGIKYLWTPSTGLNSATLNNPNYSGNKETNYIIQIINNTGCVTYDSLKVRVFTEADIQVPKAFTPNSDSHNDFLDVFVIGIKKFNYFRIFNRWGVLLYETSDPYQRWNGISNGLKQPMETYVWMAQGISDDGRVISRRGQTILIR